MPAQQILKGMAGMFESKDAKARALVKEIVVRAAQSSNCSSWVSGCCSSSSSGDSSRGSGTG